MVCPTCRAVTPGKKGNPRFPFCSERCRLVDLGKWIDEEYRIPEEPGTTPIGVPDPDSER